MLFCKRGLHALLGDSDLAVALDKPASACQQTASALRIS